MTSLSRIHDAGNAVDELAAYAATAAFEKETTDSKIVILEI